MNLSSINFGFFSLKIYGVFIALAFLIATIMYYHRLEKKDFSTSFFLQNYWKWILAGLLVGRILTTLFHFPGLFERHGYFAFLAFWDGGMNFIGVMGGFIAMMIKDLQKKKIDYFRWLDQGTVPFLIAIMITHVGGLLSGQVYGTPTKLPWGIQYETFNVDILTPIHPVTIYAFLIYGVLLLWVIKYQKLWERFSGRLALRSVFIFFCIEFLLHFFRADPTLYVGDRIRIDQILIVLALGFLIVFKKYFRIKK